MHRPLIAISEVSFTTASGHDARAGLLGWIRATVNDSLRLDGLTLRRTESGRLAISFPSRRDSSGRRHFFVRPVNDDARREVERQIIEALRFREAVS